MFWSALLRHFTGASRIEELAANAAASARHQVWERVCRQIEPMSPAEARGYVRARAAAVVHREIDRAYRNDPTLRPAWRLRLVDLTTESLIRIVADQLSFSQAIPLVQQAPAALRRAA